MIIATALFTIACAAIAWGAVCNQRTFNQRHRIRIFVYEGAGQEWNRRAAFLEIVPYSHHFWRLLFLRNPKYLYHFSLWDGLEQ